MTAGPVQVAAGAILDQSGRVLLSRRPPGAHLGGLWEFPGGKFEPAETARAALQRELREELGIEVLGAVPLIEIAHRYPEKSVVLHVWRVTRWRGEPVSREGQLLRWVELDALAGYDLPAADLPVVTALSLPPLYLLTPDPAEHGHRLLRGLEAALEAGARLVQWRGRGPVDAALVREALALCERHGARLLLNAAPEAARAAGVHGVHLSSARLMAAAARPLPSPLLVAASCHDGLELARAARIGADFAVLSPVRETASHPGQAPLGWPAFAELARAACLPVYALGGMRPEDLAQAWQRGAQGLAVLGGVWNGGPPGESTRAYLEAVRLALQAA